MLLGADGRIFRNNSLVHRLALTLIFLGFGGFAIVHAASLVTAEGPTASVIEIDGVIDSVSAGFLSRAIEEAAANGSEVLIVRLDTPGGLLSSTREMVENILDSPVPVVVYVAPQGAHAASAGTFITASAHVAAMAPTTNIGAASPVGGDGEDLPETLKSKATQDTAAFMRSIAATRGRNADALAQTVLEAVAYSAEEALENGIIDLIATDVEDLLRKIDGRVVSVNGTDVVLSTLDLTLRSIEPTPVELFLGFIANPDVAFLLLTIGGIGILIEMFSPGMIVPGLVGVILLALAFLAVGNLPVNWVGVALIVLAMGLFFMEMQAPGLGVFGMGGAVSFVLGAFLLFGGFKPPPIETPSFRVSFWLIGVVSALLFGSLLLMLRETIKSRNMPLYRPEHRELLNQIGTATTPLEPSGTVQLAGELWSAVSDDGKPIPAGEEVIVLEVDGLTLKVFKANN